MVEVVKLVGSADSVAVSPPVTEAEMVSVAPVGSTDSVPVTEAEMVSVAPVGSTDSVPVTLAETVESVPVGPAVDDSV